MIDPQVAYDKLAQFETADEIASYFEHEGIQGHTGIAFSCPIANYMSQHTGKRFTVSSGTIRNKNISFNPTASMRKFINLFDHLAYPSLITKDVPTINDLTDVYDEVFERASIYYEAFERGREEG